MIVPIFPLPNVVLFPKTMLPLHIFEQRYRVMTREAISADRSIAITLLKEGWEANYNGNPPVHEVACLGRIETFEELDDGKYNIVLSGLYRVRLLRELDHVPYRRAEVEMMQELSCDDDSDAIVTRRNRLGGLFSRYAELISSESRKASDASLRLDFETLVNVAATTLNLSAEDRQALLEMDELTDRCDALIPVLQRQLEAILLVRRFEHLKPGEPRWN